MRIGLALALLLLGRPRQARELIELAPAPRKRLREESQMTPSYGGCDQVGSLSFFVTAWLSQHPM
jgi:hypothetical protein